MRRVIENTGSKQGAVAMAATEAMQSANRWAVKARLTSNRSLKEQSNNK